MSSVGWLLWQVGGACMDGVCCLPLTLPNTLGDVLPPAECTFILLDPDHPDSEGTGVHGGAMAGALG